MTTVKSTAIQLRLKDEAYPLIGAIAKELLLAQLSAGIDGVGVRHTHPDGSPWDFRNTGRLLDSLVVAYKEGRITLIFDTAYATDVDRKAPLTMSPATRQEFTKRITPIIKQNVTNK